MDLDKLTQKFGCTYLSPLRPGSGDADVHDGKCINCMENEKFVKPYTTFRATRSIAESDESIRDGYNTSS
ncbi:hypothetical protein JYU34_015928, partial [Plutella xylostella]